MNETLFTVEEAAEQLKTTTNRLYQLAINGKLRMGVNARGWWGMWYPKQPDALLLENTDAGPVDVDEQGWFSYIHQMPSGTHIILKEFFIHHFWYIEYSQLYELLTSSAKSMEVCWYEPKAVTHQQLLDIEPAQVTEHGVFWPHQKHHGKPQDLIITLDDLLVSSSDLPELRSQPDKQIQREEALKKLISEVGLEELVPMGRQGVWNRLREVDKHLFAASSQSTIAKFFDKQNIIAFKRRAS